MPDTVTQIHTFDQPIETSVKVSIEVDSKGQRKPSVEVRITRRLPLKDTVVGGFIDEDIKAALARCKDTLKKAMED